MRLTCAALLRLLRGHLHEGVQHQSVVQPGVPVLQLLQEVGSRGLRHFPGGQFTQALDEAGDVQQGHCWSTPPGHASPQLIRRRSEAPPPPTLVDLSPGGAGVALLLGVLGQQRVLVVVAHVGFRDGDGQNAAEVGELLLVEALDQAGQVGDSLQLDHLLKNTHTHTHHYPNGSPGFDLGDGYQV